jgi:hypothetical protein
MPEVTSPVTMGPINFVVEHRRVAQACGPTVRVLGTDDDHEYLRFDMFDDNPHYHYRPPEGVERIIGIDTVAVGDPVDWVLARLRERLSPMLVEAGGARLTTAIDGEALRPAIDAVEALVRQRSPRRPGPRSTP